MIDLRYLLGVIKYIPPHIVIQFILVWLFGNYYCFGTIVFSSIYLLTSFYCKISAKFEINVKFLIYKENPFKRKIN